MATPSPRRRSSADSAASTPASKTAAPTSAAAKATVDVTLNTNDASLTMPAGTVFNAKVDDVSYKFSTITDVTKSNTGGGIPFVNTDIYEGTFISTRYTVNTSDIDNYKLFLIFCFLLSQ